MRLRQCMDSYEARTGERITYAQVAEATGLAEATIQSIATRPDYNATIRVLERLCVVLRCSPFDLIEWR
jgi:putative transcriptional regulator